MELWASLEVLAQIIKWRMPVVVHLSHLSQTAGGVDGADLRETSPDDTACCFHKPLEGRCSALVQLENHTKNP